MGGQKPAFDARLESIRGIAAFSVALTHGSMVFAWVETSNDAVAAIVNTVILAFPAGAAVILFFTLSGYVLGLSLERDGQFLPFIVRRFFRIFPALWVAILVTFALQGSFAPGLPAEAFTEWFRNVFLNNPSWDDLWRNLVLDKATIDQVVWSMKPEMICALALPLVILIHVRSGRAIRFLMLALLVAYAAYARENSIRFLACFYAGFILPREIAPLVKGRLLPLLMVFVGYLILWAGNQYGLPYTGTMRNVCALGAALVIAGIVAAPNGMKPLTWRPLRFLGRVSYSFYLLHLPSLYLLTVAVTHIPGLMPATQSMALGLLVSSIVLALAAAAISRAFIEVPGIALGRELSARVGLKYKFGKRIVPESSTAGQ